jgi:hypothetical protein
LRRAAEILQEIGDVDGATKEQARGGLSPWRVRKVTSHVDAHLDRTIRNDDLASLVRFGC